MRRRPYLGNHSTADCMKLLPTSMTIVLEEFAGGERAALGPAHRPGALTSSRRLGRGSAPRRRC